MATDAQFQRHDTLPNPHPRPDWLRRHTEAPIDPERPIIDPHHHLWDVAHRAI